MGAWVSIRMRRGHRIIFLLIALLALGTFLFGLWVLAGALKR